MTGQSTALQAFNRLKEAFSGYGNKWATIFQIVLQSLVSFNGSCYFYSGASVQTTYDGASAVSKIHRFRWELNPQLTITGLEV